MVTGYCRHKVWCISDEQYFGTLLSYRLGEQEVQHAMVHDGAMAMLNSGAGFAATDIDETLLIEIRGSMSNRTRLPDYLDWHGECHSVERFALTWPRHGGPAVRQLVPEVECRHFCGRVGYDNNHR
jgi:hypothetical protein